MFKLNSKESLRITSPCMKLPDVVASGNDSAKASDVASDAIAPVSDAEMDASDTNALPPSPSSDLRIVSQLGAGGMGVVYKARHKAVDRTLAIKMLHSRLTGDSQLVKRFENEARAASLLTHVNLASVYDYGVSAKGEPYLIMDYVDGQTLQEILKNEKSLEIPRFLRIFSQVCDALNHAHTKQLVHRDLKPANIMLMNSDERLDFVKLVDFGIAKLLPQATTDEQRLTQTGEVLGSPVYMCPEQCLGQQPDARGDIYSLGCVMYEALAGRPPFLRDNVVQTILSHLNDLPVPLSVVAPHRGISPELEKIILRCLQKDPEKRFQTVQDVKDSLELIDQETSETAKKLIAARLFKSRLTQTLKRNRLVSAVALLTCIILCTAGAFALWVSNQEQLLQAQIDFARTSDKSDSWQKAISTAEALHKPDKTVARLYSQLAYSLNSYQEEIPLKERALKKALHLLENIPSAKVEYLMVLQNLDSYYERQDDWKQPMEALLSLEKKADEAFLYAKCDEAERLFENELKLSTACWHARLGLSKILDYRARNASPAEELRLMHRASFLSGFLQDQGKRRSDLVNEAIRHLGKDPASYRTRVELGEAAQKAGDLEGAAVEYQAAIGMKPDPGSVSLSVLSERQQKIRQQILERNEAEGRDFMNDITDRRTALLERLIREQEALFGRTNSGLANNLGELTPLRLPLTRPKHRANSITPNLRSLGECYITKSRWTEAEFVYKKMFVDDPGFIGELHPTSYDPNRDFGNCPLGILAEIVIRRSSLAEAAAYDRFLVEKCLPAPGSSDFARSQIDDRIFYTWINALRKLGRTDEENQVKEMRHQRLVDHVRNAESGDAFSTGGALGGSALDIDSP